METVGNRWKPLETGGNRWNLGYIGYLTDLDRFEFLKLDRFEFPVSVCSNGFQNMRKRRMVQQQAVIGAAFKALYGMVATMTALIGAP